MRVIKYPEPEEEKFLTCDYCCAELAYTSDDIQFKDYLISIYKIIVCPVCGKDIILDKRNYQVDHKPLEFWWELTCSDNERN